MLERLPRPLRVHPRPSGCIARDGHLVHQKHGNVDRKRLIPGVITPGQQRGADDGLLPLDRVQIQREVGGNHLES